MTVIAQSRPRADLVDVAAIVRRVAATPALWEPLLQHRPERSWARVEVPEGVDVWVIEWPTDAETEFHSHGDAVAAFTAVRGTITEVRPTATEQLAVRDIGPGEVQTIVPGEVHDVINQHRERAVTIHAYSPRLTQMTYYRYVGDRLVVDRVVHDDDAEAGAW